MPEQDDILYPVSDGQPLGETEIHRDEIIYLIEAFKTRFEEEADVYVGGDLLFYYRWGDPKSVLCPDVMVVGGVPKLPMRRTFRLWEEGQAPCLGIEVTSESTQLNDFASTKACYERLKIEEFFLYDPLAECIPQLQGFRLAEAGLYHPVDPEADGSLVSHTTGVTLRIEGERIRVVETASGRRFLRDAELRREVRRLSKMRDGWTESSRGLGAEMWKQVGDSGTIEEERDAWVESAAPEWDE
jgi:Uma2 family endonuclease